MNRPSGEDSLLLAVHEHGSRRRHLQSSLRVIRVPPVGQELQGQFSWLCKNNSDCPGSTKCWSVRRSGACTMHPKEVKIPVQGPCALNTRGVPSWLWDVNTSTSGASTIKVSLPSS